MIHLNEFQDKEFVIVDRPLLKLRLIRVSRFSVDPRPKMSLAQAIESVRQSRVFH